MEKIKNCPFCYSEAVLKVTEDNSDYCFDRKTGKIIEYYDVKCTNDDCYLSDGADWNHPNPEGIIELWKLEDYLTCTVSPLQITNNITGSDIVFRGLDYAPKIKSIK